MSMDILWYNGNKTILSTRVQSPTPHLENGDKLRPGPLSSVTQIERFLSLCSYEELVYMLNYVLEQSSQIDQIFKSVIESERTETCSNSTDLNSTSDIKDIVNPGLFASYINFVMGLSKSFFNHWSEVTSDQEIEKTDSRLSDIESLKHSSHYDLLKYTEKESYPNLVQDIDEARSAFLILKVQLEQRCKLSTELEDYQYTACSEEHKSILELLQKLVTRTLGNNYQETVQLVRFPSYNVRDSTVRLMSTSIMFHLSKKNLSQYLNALTDSVIVGLNRNAPESAADNEFWRHLETSMRGYRLVLASIWNDSQNDDEIDFGLQTEIDFSNIRSDSLLHPESYNEILSLYEFTESQVSSKAPKSFANIIVIMILHLNRFVREEGGKLLSIAIKFDIIEESAARSLVDRLMQDNWSQVRFTGVTALASFLFKWGASDNKRPKILATLALNMCYAAEGISTLSALLWRYFFDDVGPVMSRKEVDRNIESRKPFLPKGSVKPIGCTHFWDPQWRWQTKSTSIMAFRDLTWGTIDWQSTWQTWLSDLSVSIRKNLQNNENIATQHSNNLSRYAIASTNRIKISNDTPNSINEQHIRMALELLANSFRTSSNHGVREAAVCGSAYLISLAPGLVNSCFPSLAYLSWIAMCDSSWPAREAGTHLATLIISFVPIDIAFNRYNPYLIDENTAKSEVNIVLDLSEDKEENSSNQEKNDILSSKVSQCDIVQLKQHDESNSSCCLDKHDHLVLSDFDKALSELEIVLSNDPGLCNKNNIKFAPLLLSLVLSTYHRGAKCPILALRAAASYMTKQVIEFLQEAIDYENTILNKDLSEVLYSKLIELAVIESHVIELTEASILSYIGNILWNGIISPLWLLRSQEANSKRSSETLQSGPFNSPSIPSHVIDQPTYSCGSMIEKVAQKNTNKVIAGCVACAVPPSCQPWEAAWSALRSILCLNSSLKINFQDIWITLLREAYENSNYNHFLSIQKLSQIALDTVHSEYLYENKVIKLYCNLLLSTEVYKQLKLVNVTEPEILQKCKEYEYFIDDEIEIDKNIYDSISNYKNIQTSNILWKPTHNIENITEDLMNYLCYGPLSKSEYEEYLTKRLNTINEYSQKSTVLDEVVLKILSAGVNCSMEESLYIKKVFESGTNNLVSPYTTISQVILSLEFLERYKIPIVLLPTKSNSTVSQLIPVLLKK